MKCYLLLSPAEGKPLAVVGNLDHNLSPSITFTSKSWNDLLNQNAKEYERGGAPEAVDRVIGRCNRITLYDPVIQFGCTDDRFEAYGYRCVDDDRLVYGPNSYQKVKVEFSQVVPKGYKIVKVVPTGLFT